MRPVSAGTSCGQSRHLQIERWLGEVHLHWSGWYLVREPWRNRPLPQLLIESAKPSATLENVGTCFGGVLLLTP
jgi:hypothetical protein